ncbi:hypothetical protein Pelo_3010 [Pelomyxa schiedti]|nr:hypothetical protein Pelo_3010 [Pelomyxa schiedti]
MFALMREYPEPESRCETKSSVRVAYVHFRLFAENTLSKTARRRPLTCPDPPRNFLIWLRLHDHDEQHTWLTPQRHQDHTGESMLTMWRLASIGGFTSITSVWAISLCLPESLSLLSLSPVAGMAGDSYMACDKIDVAFLLVVYCDRGHLLKLDTVALFHCVRECPE